MFDIVIVLLTQLIDIIPLLLCLVLTLNIASDLIFGR